VVTSIPKIHSKSFQLQISSRGSNLQRLYAQHIWTSVE
jgi:hypothetical protein